MSNNYLSINKMLIYHNMSYKKRFNMNKKIKSFYIIYLIKNTNNYITLNNGFNNRIIV
jgi:hypothetical protein